MNYIKKNIFLSDEVTYYLFMYSFYEHPTFLDSKKHHKSCIYRTFVHKRNLTQIIASNKIDVDVLILITQANVK